MTIEEIIDTIKEQDYIPKFEIALYNWDDSVDETLEFSVDEIDEFYSTIGYTILRTDYKYFQLSLIGQTEDGGNEIVYNLNDIFNKNWSNSYEIVAHWHYSLSPKFTTNRTMERIELYI